MFYRETLIGLRIAATSIIGNHSFLNEDSYLETIEKIMNASMK